MKSSEIKSQFRDLQLLICDQLALWDGQASFHEDKWKREDGGGGFTSTIGNGRIIEKGGVAFSAVEGEVTKLMKDQLNLEGNHFFATGVSIVLHPKHPRHPIIHMNIRYFEIDEETYWFGGGIDLTPHYINDDLAAVFHQRLKSISDKYDPGFYLKFKNWADDYFFLPHRNETRGIGGIFFDHITGNNSQSKHDIFRLCMELGTAFPSIYQEQVDSVSFTEITPQEKLWQNIRRSRYVEFNLLHDRGTKFGIYSQGRTESILMSMPPEANWIYNHLPTENSEEELTLNKLIKGKSWL